jgi:aromatic ring hydroxylase
MPIRTGEEYIQSLRGRKIKVYLFGELVKEPVDHPMIRPSINAVAETYNVASTSPELASARSSLTGKHNAEKTGPTYRDLFSKMCRNGCIEFTIFNNI